MSASGKGWILPSEIDPPRVCVSLEIPNERQHIAAFWGALWLLTYWNQWERDNANTGTQVAQVWKQVWFDAVARNEGLDGCEGVGMFDVRQSTENPCTLEKSTNGFSWSAWANLTLCKPSLKFVGGVPVWTNPVTGIDEPFETTPLDEPVYPPRAPRPESGQDTPRCNAAAGAAQIFASTAREAANQFNAGGELSLMLLFIGLIFLPLGIAITAGLALAAIANDLLALVLGVPASEVSAQVEEDLACIFYCRTEINAGIISVDFSGVLGDLNNLSAGNDGYALVRAVIETLGESGALAALDVRGVSGNCNDCDCPGDPEAWDVTYSFLDIPRGATILWAGGSYPNPSGQWISGIGYRRRDVGGWNALRLTWDIPPEVRAGGVQQAQLLFTKSATASVGLYLREGATNIFTIQQGNIFSAQTNSGVFNVPLNADNFFLSWVNGAPFDLQLNGIRFIGFGVPPVP